MPDIRSARHLLLFTFSPNADNLAADNCNIHQRDQNEQHQSCEQSGKKRTFSYLWEDALENAHVVASEQPHHDKGDDEHGHIQTNGQQLIRAGNTRGAVTYKQQVLELGGILLNKQEDAEHENIEAEQ